MIMQISFQPSAPGFSSSAEWSFYEHRDAADLAQAMANRWPELAFAVVRTGHDVIEAGHPLMLDACRAFARIASTAAADGKRATALLAGPVVVRALSRPLRDGYAIACGPASNGSVRALARRGAKVLCIFDRTK